MKALADIVNDENWCQCAFAKDENGVHVDPLDPRAVKRCMLGWLQKKYADPASFHNAVKRLHKVCLRRHNSMDIIATNDMWVKDASEIASIFAEARV